MPPCLECVACTECGNTAFCLSEPGTRPCSHDQALCDDCRHECCADCRRDEHRSRLHIVRDTP